MVCRVSVDTVLSVYVCIVHNVYVHMCSCMVCVSMWYVMYVVHGVSVVWLCQCMICVSMYGI